jgi:hypothetical protein
VSQPNNNINLEKKSISEKVVELLIFVDNENPLCKTESSFNSLLQSNSDITIANKSSLKYKNFTFKYILKSDTIDKKNEKGKFFNIKIILDDITDEKIECFSELIRQLKSIFTTVLNQLPQTLWDDISYYYSIQAYPVIHEIENILRKLITKFMLINIGTGWTVNSIPDDFKSSKKSSAGSNTSKPSNHNLLYDADFIQLSNFLFDEYREIDVPDLISKLKSIGTEGTNENTIEEIKKFIPKSNWQKHFQEHINCEAEFLKKRWLRLYDLRCKIAHNNTFTKTDLAETLTIVNEIKPTLIDATNKLDVIKISENEKEKLTDELNLLDSDNISKLSNRTTIELNDSPQDVLFMYYSSIVLHLKAIGSALGVSPYSNPIRISEELLKLNVYPKVTHDTIVNTHNFSFDALSPENNNNKLINRVLNNARVTDRNLRNIREMIRQKSQ